MFLRLMNMVEDDKSGVKPMYRITLQVSVIGGPHSRKGRQNQIKIIKRESKW